ncbi:MAG TPA: hypothetical protein VMW25_03365, partial [Clostridia bacterium]|nr:hypothetical protein [Clostridia bacterium]
MAKAKKDKEKRLKASGKGERFADMSAEAVIIKEPKLNEEIQTPQEVQEKAKEPRVRGKKYQSLKAKVDRSKSYPPKEAFELLKEISFANFKGTVEVHLNVVEKGLSGEVTLPHFGGKTRKVVIFSDEVAKKVKTGKIDFDVLLASPADMPKILPLAKTLGPQGLMPNPKNGTLVPDPKKAQEKFSSNALFYKTEKDFPIIHLVVGQLDQPTKELVENFETLVKAINSKKIRKAVVKSTMSP